LIYERNPDKPEKLKAESSKQELYLSLSSFQLSALSFARLSFMAREILPEKILISLPRH